MARGSSGARPLAGWAPWSAGSAGGAGLGPAADRCLAPAPGHPLAGQAGPAPLNPLPGREAPPVMGGADPRSAARPRIGPEEAGDPVDVARNHDAAGPAAAERPAPRDQLETDPAPPADPFDPVPFGRGGRSRGGATRAPLSASVTFLARAAPAPLTARREPALTSPSGGGGASGRSREAYASPVPA